MFLRRSAAVPHASERTEEPLPTTAVVPSPAHHQARSSSVPITVPTSFSLRRRRRETMSDSDRLSQELIVMAKNHMLGWVVMMYAMLLISRLCFGWTPGRANIATPMVPIAPENVTLVTAYFDIPSKRPSSEYLPWIRRMMTLRDNMVIITSPDQAKILQRLRGNRPTHTITMELNETNLVKQYGMEFWQYQNSLEPGLVEKYIHSKELYIVWNSKGHFLQKVMDLKPFPESKFYAWVDMGYLRDDLLENQCMIRYLPADLTEQQALFLDVRKLVHNDYLGGGFIGGYEQGLRAWTQEYYELLDANRDRFIGKDQPWMFKTCTQHPGLCLWVQAKGTYGDPWFYMGPYLHGAAMYGTLDHLQRVWQRSMLRKILGWFTEEHINLSQHLSTASSTSGESQVS